MNHERKIFRASRQLACMAAFSMAMPLPGALAQEECTPQRLAGPDGTSRGVGRSLAVNDRHILIGDAGAHSLCPGGGDPFGCKAGAVYAFQRDLDGWRMIQMIVPPDIRILDGFGSRVVLDPLDPDRVVIASGARVVGEKRGYGLVYEYDGHAWQEVARFDPPDVGRTMTTSFAASMAIHGNTMLVTQVPFVYQYKRLGGSWVHQRTLEPPVEVGEGSSFGVTGFLIDDTWAFIGAHRDRSLSTDPANPILHGSLQVYRHHPDGSLEYAQRLLPPFEPGELPPRGWFGNSVGFDGRTLVVGAPATNGAFENQGVAYVYELEGEAWALRQELRSSIPGRLHFFGSNIQLRGDTLIIGHNTWDSAPNRSHLFRRGPDGLWHETDILRPGSAAMSTARGFGSAAAMHGRWAIFGAPDENPGGAAYVFDLDCVLGTNPCPVDMDGDGQLTIFDYLAFQTAFGTGDLQADFDGDGELTIFDFLAFQTAFAAGCE